MDYITHFIIQWSRAQNKTSPNNGILLNVNLISRLLSNPFASCFLMNFDFLEPHIAHFDNIIFLPLLVTRTFGSILSVFVFFFFLHFKQ